MLDEIVSMPSDDSMENLKFGECLPPVIASEVFAARFTDPEAIAAIRREPLRVVVAGEGTGEPSPTTFRSENPSRFARTALASSERSR
jgi:hypothetical protein